ncbi:hypothetical protein [Micrococcus sp.]|uniref:hypothetical protein n=1 Tax=Micrococcus sp. TaxID=1271 RepID=UPI0026DBE1F3|nr:hypothetical protein [Micrococcus sp.]MDO4239149.1 hypothetical protein [Micrococcus sp.]
MSRPAPSSRPAASAAPSDPAAATPVRLGVLVAPDVDPAAAAALDPAALAARLDAAYPGLAWEVRVSAEDVGDDDDDSLDLLEITRDRMLDEDWDVAVGLTGRALVQGPHTLAEQVSPVHSTGVVSLALAPGDAQEAVARVVARLLGLDPDEGKPDEDDVRDAVRWARQLAADIEDRAGESGVSFAGRVAGRNARMILGTVRANRPWMLAVSLTRSMSTALATGALTLLTTDLWMLSAEYNGVQMGVLGVLSIVAVTLSLVVGAKLWERPRRAAEREQVAVFNLATVLTVLIGVLVLHALLMLAALAGALLLVDADVFEAVTGEAGTFWQYVKLAWFVGGLATIGSALGAGLEDDDDVRQAIFTRGAR